MQPMPSMPDENGTNGTVAAALYLRISRARDGSTIGVERQLPTAVQVCQRSGWTVPALEAGTTVAELLERIRAGEPVDGIYVDNDLSAYSQRKPRPGYLRMLADVRARRWGAIAAFDPDRLCRNPRDNEDLIDLAEADNIKLGTWTGDYDLSTSGGRAAFRTEGVRARRESEQRGERLQAMHRQIREQGRWRGGKPPYGYRYSGGVQVPSGRDGLVRVRYATLELDPAEAPILRQAAERILGGGTISGALRAFVAANRARGPGARGSRWQIANLRDRLTSRQAAALIQADDGQLVDGCWPAIIGRTEHEQLAELLGGGRRLRNPGAGAPLRQSLLTGFLFHDAADADPPCTSRLYSKRNNSSVPGYRCDRQFGGCDRLHRMAGPIDEQVRDAVLVALANPAFRRALRAASDQAGGRTIAELVAERDSAKRWLAELGRALGAQELDLPGYNIARAEAARRLREVEAELERSTDTHARLLAQLPDTYPGLRARWNAADLDERRTLIDLAVERVWVRSDGRGYRWRLTDHARIIWRA